MSRPRAAPRVRPAKVGEKYASPGDAVRGVGPFTTLVVTAVHKEGAVVDLATTEIDDDRTWKRVPVAKLVRVG